MKQQTPTQRKINDIVCETITLDKIALEEDLMDAGLLDSLAIIHLMVALENAFSITIDPEEVDFEDYRSVKSMSEMISRSSMSPPISIGLSG